MQSVIVVAHPLTLTLSPEAGERGFFRLPLPLGEGWGEGAFSCIDAQSCYDFLYVPSSETFSFAFPLIRVLLPRTMCPSPMRKEFGAGLASSFEP